MFGWSAIGFARRFFPSSAANGNYRPPPPAATVSKESLIRKTEAEADRKVAEVVEAANRATLHIRQDAIAQLERQLKEAELAKTEAEAEAIRKDAETRQIEGVANAQARLLEAIGKLRAENGDMFVSQGDLQKILRLGATSTEPPGRITGKRKVSPKLQSDSGK